MGLVLEKNMDLRATIASDLGGWEQSSRQAGDLMNEWTQHVRLAKCWAGAKVETKDATQPVVLNGK
jgi:hypothetical protein